MEKEYLLLCELANLDMFNIDQNSNDKNISSLLSDTSKKNTVLEDISANLKIQCLKLKNSKIFKRLKVYIFENTDCAETDIVFSVSTQQKDTKPSEYKDEVIEFIEQNKGRGKCVLTGVEVGGLYASELASKLGIEAIVFGVPSTEKLSGNIKNYVAENEPVGKFIEKIIFVKQKSTDVNINEPYSQILVFDEDGRVVVGEQSEYSKFCSWFYNTTGHIKNEIWKMFFKSTSEYDSLEDKDLYSIFLKVNELDSEGIENSLKNTIKYIENEFDKNREMKELEFYKNIQDIEITELEKIFFDVTKKATNNAVEIVKNVYSSVEMILIGVTLFTLGKNSCDVNGLMEEFVINVDKVLENEIEKLTTFLGNQDYLDLIAIFEGLCLE